jgi:hypothetical protein
MDQRIEYLYKLIITVVFFLTATCGSKRNNVVGKESAQVKEISQKEEFYINDSDQVQIAAISIGEVVEIYAGDDYLFRECRDETKCKYRDGDGSTKYEVKYKAGGFKINDRTGTLLIKVKSADGVTKIGMDEEMTDPYRIKTPSPDKSSLVKNNTEIGAARMGQDVLPVKVSDSEQTCYIAGPRKSPYEVVVTLPDTDMGLRVVLLAELLMMK